MSELRPKIDWQSMADRLGYADKDSMIVTLYSKIGAPTIAAFLGVDQNSILDRLQRLGIAKRPRGGPNNRRAPIIILPCGRTTCRHGGINRIGCPASEIGREHCERHE
jgi:hypothetical protein